MKVNQGEAVIPAVKLVGITKRFPGVVANDRINFEVRPGEIHALLGENGAGKSTLMNILVGLYRPDEGEIYLRGQKVTLRGPADAIAQGVGLVYQHFKLVPNQTVAENVALGMRKPRFVLNLRQVEQDLQKLGEKHNLPVRPRAMVGTLSVGEQQRAEILRVLYLGATILALDEPTANLTPQETTGLFAALRRLAAEGYALIFISHKLEEVISLANRATILRGGKAVATLDLKGDPGEKEQIARLMIGREADESSKVELGLLQQGENKASASATGVGGDPALRVDNLRVTGENVGSTLKGVSFEVRPGEIVGLVGVAGNGQRELAEALAGLRPVQSGSVRLKEAELVGKDPRQIKRLGISFVPEDRLGMGVAAGLDLEDNFILRDYWRSDYSAGPFVRRDAAGRDLTGAIKQYSIAVGDPYAPARLLSGGNLQKLLLARELATNPEVLIVANPTRGLDIGASAYVHNKLREARDRGAAILLIVEDLDEGLLLSNRLLVMYEGQLTGEVPPLRTAQNLERIGLLMAGAKNSNE
jgi:simple sugar transport system ATP-binding protein